MAENNNSTHSNSVEGTTTEISIHFLRFKPVLPYIFMLLSISTVLAVCIVLVAFCKTRSIRTPFNVYLISLLVADVLTALFDIPFTIAGLLQPGFRLTFIGCNFRLYAQWMFSSVVRNMHVLISFNRIWALFWPYSYRHYHNTRVAVGICLGGWVYVHAFVLPGLVLDAMYYRSADGPCQVNTTAVYSWALPDQLVINDLAVVLVLLTYPVIWWKMKQRGKVIAVANPSSGSKPLTNDTLKGQLIDDPNKLPPNEEAAKPPLPIDLAGLPLSRQASQPSGQPLVRSASSPPKKRSQSFRVLTYLVISVLLCWTPIVTYYTLDILVAYDNYWYWVVGSLLYYLNSLLDPILFTLAITPLRSTIFTMFSRR